MDMPRLPLFKIAADVFDAVNLDDIFETVFGMHEIGIYKPPFQEMFIQTKIKLIEKMASSEEGQFKFFDKDENVSKAEARFYFYFYGTRATMTPFIAQDGKTFIAFDARKSDNQGMNDWFIWMGRALLATLIVLLATKNIEKHVETYNKPHSRNRREKRLSQFSSVTTIKIGKITETIRSDGSSGASVRPHLRRGHIRHQNYGPNNSKVKKIFIEPIFVNADEGWITGRKTYRVVA